MHHVALALALIGSCSLLAHGRSARASECAASLLMVAAMIDTGRAQPWLPPIVWTAVLLAAAVTLAIIHRTRRRAPDSDRGPSDAHSALFTSLGLVIMSALLLGMPAEGPSAPGAHHHGAPLLLPLLLFATGVYVVASSTGVVRMRHPLDRIHLAAMGVSAGLMGVAAIA